MFTYFFNVLSSIDTFFWGYIGFAMIIFLGCYFTFYTGFFQIRVLPSIFRTFMHFLRSPSEKEMGTHPIKVFFASVGGMIGVGNVVGIVTALQLGGPGALLWVWVAAFAGTLIKYSEIYLGLKYRMPNQNKGFDGGPMFFLKKAFKTKWISVAIAFLLCIYGAEVYQFTVIVDTVSQNWHVNRLLVMGILLGLVLYAGIGGVPRVAKICSWVMPVFVVSYIAMCIWVIGHYLPMLPNLLMTVFQSAFTGHAAIGGFLGSTALLAIQNGMAGACYSADIGIGYDSIIQSESHTIYPERQARMAILGVLIDNLVCTMSVLVVLVTGIWQSPNHYEGSFLVQAALESYFPYMFIIMPFFILVLGYTTLISYFTVGLKCASYLHPTRGPSIYLGYAAFVLIFFSFFDQTQVLLLMRIAGALLLMVNLAGIYRLRNEIEFVLDTPAVLVEVK